MTQWSHHVRYSCRHTDCQAECINHLDASCTHYKQCRDCYQSHRVGLRPRTDHLPDQPIESEGERETACPAAQRSEQPGPTAERSEAVVPSRPTGSAPSRGDPEARAPPPNPEGEGNLDSRSPAEQSRFSDTD